jgi:hypothetical protein
METKISLHQIKNTFESHSRMEQVEDRISGMGLVLRVEKVCQANGPLKQAGVVIRQSRF